MPIDRLLAIDAAGAACSAAVWRDGALAASTLEVMRRGQAERLVPMAEAVMAEADLSYDALQAIAVTLGPGGFTGVRIGLAAARGYALALKLPIIAKSNFSVLAAATAADERRGRAVIALIDAKRRDLYAQSFDEGLRPLCEPMALAPEDLIERLPAGPLLLVGDAVDQARPVLKAAGLDYAESRAGPHAEAAVLARLAAAEALPGEPGPPPRPLYLRAPDVTLPGRGAD